MQLRILDLTYKYTMVSRKNYSPRNISVQQMHEICRNPAKKFGGNEILHTFAAHHNFD